MGICLSLPERARATSYFNFATVPTFEPCSISARCTNTTNDTGISPPYNPTTINFPPSEDYRRQRRALYAQEDINALVRLHQTNVFSEPATTHMREQSIRTVLALPRETILSFFDPDPELDIRAVLSQIAVPTLVAHGTDDLVVPLANGVYIGNQIPGAQFYPFEGKGHLPMFTAIDEFRDVLRQFVRSGTVD